MNRLSRWLEFLGAALFLGCAGSLLLGIAVLRRSAPAAAPVLPAQLISPDALPDGSFLTIGRGRIRAIAYAPDGKMLATATSIGITLYDTVEFQPRLTIPTDRGADNILWSPDGRALAAAVGFNLVLYDAATGRELWRMSESQPAVVGQAMAWSPDGRYIAARALLTYQAHVWIWDAWTGERIAELRNRHRFPYAEGLAWSPDSQKLAVSYWYGSSLSDEPDELYIWEVSDRPQAIQKWPIPDYAARKLAWSPDGRFLVGGGQGSVHIIDAADGRVLADVDIGTSNGEMVTVSPDWQLVAVGEGSERVTVYELPSLTKRAEVGVQNMGAGSLIWSPRGDALAAISVLNSDVLIWSVADGSLLGQIFTGSYPSANLSWSPDSTHLAAVAGDGTTRIYAADTGELAFVVNEDNAGMFPGPNLAWSPDGRMLATTMSKEGEAGQAYITTIWSPVGEPLGIIPGMLGAWSSSGDSLTVMSHNVLQQWEVSADQPPRLQAEEDVSGSSYFPSPDGKLFAQINSSWDPVDGGRFHATLLIRRVVDASQVVELGDEGMSYVRSLAWSSDGQWLVASYDIDAGAGDHSHAKLTVWSTTTWEVVRSFDHLSGSSWTLSWSPDGQWIAATDAPSGYNMSLYPLSDSLPILEIDAHHGAVESVAWSPDGRRIASAGYDGQLIIWDVATLMGERVTVTPAATLTPLPES